MFLKLISTQIKKTILTYLLFITKEHFMNDISFTHMYVSKFFLLNFTKPTLIILLFQNIINELFTNN